MRCFFLWMGLFLVPGLLAAGGGNDHKLFKLTAPESSRPLVQTWLAESDSFEALYKKLENDFGRFGESERMVRAIFYRSHQQLFRHYRQFTLDRDALISGQYDCVSGSLILAALLDHFGFSYEVIETSYHVFLQVDIKERRLLLEVTDPQGGFIADPIRMEEYINAYFEEHGNNFLWDAPGSELAFESSAVYQSINLQNLLGLQYFNQSIRYFNEGNPLAAYQFSVTALKYHDSERIRIFRDFLKQELMLAVN